MRDIIVDIDVFTEEFLAQTIGEEATLIVQGGSAEIAEHLAHQIQDCGWFQDHGVVAG